VAADCITTAADERLRMAKPPRQHWLMKSEPGCYGIDDLRRQKTGAWDGVRNYQARNFMRAMRIGDAVLFYHSNAAPSGVAGLAEVCREAYPDHTAWDPSSEHPDPTSTPDDPRWFMVDVRFVRAFPQVLALDALRRIPELAGMELFKRSRLSVQPVTEAQYRVIVEMAEG
jgi:predicted RNA-binding protein with PUA-like domain